jgi:hypothetical protein
MSDALDTTYRVVSLTDDWTGKTAATPELAKLIAGDLYRGERLGMERTDWVDNFGKPKAHRSVLIDAEKDPGEWELGLPEKPARELRRI